MNLRVCSTCSSPKHERQVVIARKERKYFVLFLIESPCQMLWNLLCWDLELTGGLLSFLDADERESHS